MVGGKYLLLVFYCLVVSLVSVGVSRWIGFFVRCGYVMWFCMFLMISLLDIDLWWLFLMMLLSLVVDVGLLMM